MKLMIVDDSPRIRRLLKMIIDNGNLFSECEDGEEAVKTYSSFLPDWVLMDLEMPKMNGLEASEQIINEYPSAKILIVTQYDEPELRQQSGKIGIKGYILKDNLYQIPEILMTAN